MIPVVLDIAKGISLSLSQKITCFPSFASSFLFFPIPFLSMSSTLFLNIAWYTNYKHWCHCFHIDMTLET